MSTTDTVTTATLEQAEELFRALREGSADRVAEVLGKAAQQTEPAGDPVDIEQLIGAAVPRISGLTDRGQQAARGAAGTLGDAGRPSGVWEAEPPQIVMYKEKYYGDGRPGSGGLQMLWDGIYAVGKAVYNAVGGSGSSDGGSSGDGKFTYDNGYDPSRDAQN
ncbi:hypothetical protein [Streptomyces eurythermus]|uniref:hypothetical protein n=1 Tax=Streptomyces eurythermus TaxID=42237 RepID=UPI0036D39125